MTAPDYSMQAILRRVALRSANGDVSRALERIAQELDDREEFEEQVHRDALNDSMDPYGSGE